MSATHTPGPWTTYLRKEIARDTEIRYETLAL